MNEAAQGEAAATRIAEAIRRMGPVFDDEVLRKTYALFAPLQEQAPRANVAVHRDLAYGGHPRHRLDVFIDADRGADAPPAPVVVYFHGGGYIGGERSPLPGLIYDNVPTFFARHGMVGVNATYRLAPEHRWPSGGEDVGAAVAWLIDNVARYGGDPGKIVVMGQSAGATHAATWTFIEKVHGRSGPRIAGAILLSGVYGAVHPDYSLATPRENQFAYYGPDTSRWPDMAPFGHIKPGHPPVFIVTSEHEPYYFVWPSVALLDALLKCDRRLPWFRLLRDHNHVSSAMQINSAVDTLGSELVAFVASLVR